MLSATLSLFFHLSDENIFISVSNLKNRKFPFLFTRCFCCLFGNLCKHLVKILL
nr:MAG TPA: hypothetical protein [Caudoviricetes sp.]